MRPTLFGTSGIRGDAEEFFTNQFCFDIGRSFAKYLEANKLTGSISVGMDPRGSSPRIKEQVIKGLNYEGFLVNDEGATSVPSMCYVLHTDPGIAGSIMVTGSHIKAHLNGVKFFAKKEEILKQDEVEIEKIYNSLKEKVKVVSTKANFLVSENAKEDYKDLLGQIALKNYPKWKIVVDAGDGAQSDTFSVVLKQLGIEVIEQNCTIQGEFFARDTENFEDFKNLGERVVKENADFGMGFDSDGDRVIFVNRKGEFIPGELTACIIAKASPLSSVVTTITASQVVESIGKKVIRTKVGSPYVVKEMKDSGSKFGFEANGGGISGEIMYTRDGGTTALKVLNVLAKRNITLEDTVDEFPKFYLFKTKVDYKWEMKDKIIAKAREIFDSSKIDDTDGLKIWTDDTSWILFRSSQNAPEFRIFAESSKEEEAKKLIQDGVNLVKRVINE